MSGAHDRGSGEQAITNGAGRRPRLVQLTVTHLRPDLTIVEAAGQIDLAERDRFDACLQQAAGAVPAGGCLLVDLTGVSFLAACGVRSLLRATEAVTRRPGQLRLVVTDDRARLPLDVLGVTATVPTFASRRQACP